jgi:hypothetical protein
MQPVMKWMLAAGAVAAVAACSSGGDDSSAFSTPAIRLTLNSQTGEVQFTDLSLSNMKPGDEMYAGLTVGNAGNAGFTYNMSTAQSGDEDLAQALRIGIAAVSGDSCTASVYRSGTSVYADTAGLSNAAISGRALPAGHSAYLCFHVELPSDAGSAMQGESAGATFNFTAQQS